MSTRVMVIGGGQTPEHDVSTATAKGICEALASEGMVVTSVTIGRDGVWAANGEALGGTVASSVSGAIALLDDIDVVFPAVHGPLGEDGTLAAMCALAHVRMVGSDTRTSAIAMDKWVTKLVANAVGVQTAGGSVVHADDIADAVFDGGDVVVKPIAAGSSFGVSRARTEDEFRAALADAAKYDDRILVEEFVHGREIDIAIIRKADGSLWEAPALEVNTDDVFDFDNKYGGSAPFTIPANLTAEEAATMSAAARTVYEALGCQGIARVDFFLTDRGPVLNEVNTMPGMTPESQVPRMFKVIDVTYADICRTAVEAAKVPAVSQLLG